MASDLAAIPLKSFHGFPLLPPELRLRIWASSFKPCTIRIHIHERSATHWLIGKDDNGRSGGVTEVTASVCFSSTTNANETDSSSRTYYRMNPTPLKAISGPTALRVCCESRALALRKYDLCFGGVRLEDDGTYWEANIRGDKLTWVNFEIDTVLLRTSAGYLSVLAMMTKYAPDETKRIQHLAVGRQGRPWMWDGRRTTMELLAKFEALRDVSLVVPEMEIQNKGNADMASRIRDIQRAVQKTFEDSAEWCPSWKTWAPSVALVDLEGTKYVTDIEDVEPERDMAVEGGSSRKYEGTK